MVCFRFCEIVFVCKLLKLVVKPENKIYKEGGVYNNSKCCYNIKKKKKKGERWGQNGINKRWDYKYPSLLSSMAG